MGKADLWELGSNLRAAAKHGDDDDLLAIRSDIQWAGNVLMDMSNLRLRAVIPTSGPDYLVMFVTDDPNTLMDLLR